MTTTISHICPLRRHFRRFLYLGQLESVRWKPETFPPSWPAAVKILRCVSDVNKRYEIIRPSKRTVWNFYTRTDGADQPQRRWVCVLSVCVTTESDLVSRKYCSMSSFFGLWKALMELVDEIYHQASGRKSRGANSQRFKGNLWSFWPLVAL